MMRKTNSTHWGVYKMQAFPPLVRRFGAIPLCVALICVLSWIPGASPVFAQDSANTPSANSAQGAREVSDAEVKAVAQDLWCPLCSGVRLDTCELKACEQMRQEIAIQLADGKSPESIKEYFLAQYGPQVLGEPPRAGFNLLAWIVPFAVLLGAAGILLFRSRRLLSQRLAVQGADADWEDDWAEDDDMESTPIDDLVHNLPDDAHIVQNGEPAGSYERALDEELRQYE
ncbi:MAG: cytochrome c-type biogenesis protein CcmH [Caldilineaceae bacterium]